MTEHYDKCECGWIPFSGGNIADGTETCMNCGKPLRRTGEGDNEERNEVEE